MDRRSRLASRGPRTRGGARSERDHGARAAAARLRRRGGGTGVVYKLAQALGVPGLDRHLDLVALATIADVVPLVDENRVLTIAGLKRLMLAERPGVAALMRTARVDPAAVDEGAVAFRLAPRINAAGRLCRPAGVEVGNLGKEV